jgi:selenocysteine lyase/cysteine desulfurase
MIDHHAASWVARDRYELRPDARRFENWEASFADRLGLGAAIDYALALGVEAIRDRAWALAADLRERLAAIPGVEVRDTGAVRSAIVTFTVDGVAPAALKAALAAVRMNVTVAEADSARLDMEARGLEAVVRASPHYYNTEEEVSRFSDEVARLAREPFSTAGV